MVFIGSNAVDIVFYISKICSINYKILIYDLSNSNYIMNVVSPLGYTVQQQNIKYAKYDENKLDIEDYYDLVITYSDVNYDIPRRLLSGDTYVFTTLRKCSISKVSKGLEYLNKRAKNIFLVCRGYKDSENSLMNRMFILGIPYQNISQVFFISDNNNDNEVLFHMEYNAVFFYESLSKELKKILHFVYNRLDNMFDLSKEIDEKRFKWVM